MKSAFHSLERAGSHICAAHQFITVGGINLAYRERGPRGGVSMVRLNHWGAVMVPTPKSRDSPVASRAQNR
jgi:hypothetical protein